MISREPRSTCSKVSLSAATCLVLRPSLPLSISRWSRELDTSVTPIRSLTFPSCPLVRSSRPPGTESSFSLEDWRCQRLRTLTPSLILLFSISNPWPPFQTPLTLRFSCAQPFAPILVAFPFPISVPTRVGSASATVPFTINSAELDRVPPKQTCPTSTIPSTDLSSALRSRSSPMSPPSSSTFEEHRYPRYDWCRQSERESLRWEICDSIPLYRYAVSQPY